jgi:hypothetical protein
MEIYIKIIVGYLFLIIATYIYGFGRLYFQILPVAVNYLIDEKVEWNS